MAETEKNKVRVFRWSRGKLQEAVEPIVLEYQERKTEEPVDGEKKARYSTGLKDAQRLEEDVVRVAQRSAKALSKGLDTYERERQRSAVEKKDGAIEDFAHNSAKAASAYMKEISDIPVDIAESLNPVSYRRRLRKQLRRMSRGIRLFRI